MAAQPRQDFLLSQPIQAHGEEVTVLRLRWPNAGDLAKAGGRPFRITNQAEMAEAADTDTPVMPDVEWFYDKANALISRIAEVPKSSVEALAWGDYERLLMTVLTFFLQSFQAAGEAGERETPPAAASSIPASGSPPASTSHGSGSPIPAPSLRSIGRS